jgi:hypothetical protein
LLRNRKTAERAALALAKLRPELLTRFNCPERSLRSRSPLRCPAARFAVFGAGGICSGERGSPL